MTVAAFIGVSAFLLALGGLAYKKLSKKIHQAEQRQKDALWEEATGLKLRVTNLEKRL